MSFITNKPQFTQAAMPFCSLSRVCLISLLGYVVLAVLALFAAHQMVDWFNVFIVHLLWLQPTILLSFPLLCALEKHTLNLKWGKTSLNTALLLLTPCLLAFGFGFVLEGFAAKAPLIAPLLTPLLKYQALALTGLLSTLLIYFRKESMSGSVGSSPELEEADLRHLGAAIRPHFFFNALNAVMGLIRSEPKQAEAVLQDTAELFRSVMMQHEQRLVSLATELETCEQYTRIEQARLAHRLRLNWQIDTALLGVSVPPFSLQPLIENAIRHGIEPLINGAKFAVTGKQSCD
jgi:two-component system sensor histidine kinase AlgZ